MEDEDETMENEDKERRKEEKVSTFSLAVIPFFLYLGSWFLNDLNAEA